MSTGTFVFPTSFAQRRLWFVHQLEPTSPSYNVTTAMWLSGSLDELALQRSLATIVDRHEALRTTFRLSDGEPVQVVAPALQLELPVADRSGMCAADREGEVQRVIQEEGRLAFDLENGPLLRARLLRFAPEEHALILVVHHIVFDGWSAGVLSRELGECYRAYTSGEAPGLPELSVQYADYAVWQREWLAGEAFERQLAYWRSQLAGAPAVLELPTDFPRPRAQTYRGATERLLLSRQLLERLTALSQQEGATLFMTLLAGFQLLLSRYTGQTDIVVGSPIANRIRSELEPLIGFFVNSLALRTDLSGDPSFRELLRQVRRVALGAYAHQDLPFERVVEELHPERIGQRNPFFQVVFALQNTPRTRLTLPGIKLRSLPRRTGTSKFDLTLHMHQVSGGLQASLEYNSDLFEQETITRMLRLLEKLLEEVTEDPDQRLSAIQLLGDAERRRLLVEWNETDRTFPAEACVHQLFESHAAQQPDAAAIEDGSESLTYGELNRRANRVAWYLRRCGVGPEVRVAVALERSADFVVAVLAVLKAGGAYVPLDSSYPAERLGLMIEDAGTRVLLTKTAARPDVLPVTLSVVELDGDRDRIDAESDENLENRTSAESLAYVMYTSGSTGRPKGIGVPHRAISRLVLNTDYVLVTPEDRIAQISSASFDATTFEFWGALLNGARMVIIPRDIVLSPAEYGTEIRNRGITTTFVTTALFNQLAEAAPNIFATVRQVLFGGEAVDSQQVRRVLEQEPPERLLHVYGPTEATTFATWFQVRELPPNAQTVPIGRAIANTHVYVLDQHLAPVPVGIPGELYLGGPGLARGYLGQPGLTAERFVPDPFGPQTAGGSGGRLYRTGDRVKWRSDGTLEFLGRFDEQVKIRGHRIEPGEIESALARHPAVRECAVVLREDVPGGRALVAYVAAGTSNGAGQTSSANLVPDLRAYLRERLPEYMVPSAFVLLAALPLTPNGKISRRTLPPPTGLTELPSSSVAPSTSTEKTLAELWKRLLNVERVGVEDNFFDLGGHSLLAVRLFADIEQAFGRRLPLSTLFQAPTLKKLAEVVSNQLPADSESGFVVLQAGGTRPPLFVVHGIYGDVMQYRELAGALGPDQPVYGFEAPHGNNGQPVLSTIEDLAATYTRQMRAKYPAGPYFLCGYCWAGPVAFEMARQLRALGQEVGLLALIDSPRPKRQDARRWHRRIRVQTRRYWKLVVTNSRRLLTLEPSAIPGFLRERLVNLITRWTGVPAYRMSVRLRRPLLPTFRQTRGALLHAARAYRPEVYPGRVVVFRARAAADPRSEDHMAGWAHLAADGVEFRDITGEHLTIMQEPHVRGLAADLRTCLERACAKLSGAPHLS